MIWKRFRKWTKNAWLTLRTSFWWETINQIDYISGRIRVSSNFGWKKCLLSVTFYIQIVSRSCDLLPTLFYSFISIRECHLFYVSFAIPFTTWPHPSVSIQFVIVPRSDILVLPMCGLGILNFGNWRELSTIQKGGITQSWLIRLIGENGDPASGLDFLEFDCFVFL